jgi:hypothetical protein
MTTNDVIILDNLLKQKKEKIADSLSDSDFFEIFTFEQILKNYDISYDDLLSGKVGGTDDGGIDGFFILLNDENINEDINPDSIQKNPILKLFLIQSKNSNSFSEKAFDRVIGTVNDIFDLKKNMNTLKSFYNENLIEKGSIFRKTYLDLSFRHPSLKIFFIYVTKGNEKNIDVKVKNRAKILEDKIRDYFNESCVKVKFIGARDLLNASRAEKSYTLQLNFVENYLSKGDDSYIVLVNLINYYQFITDENNNIRRYIFESNVRDFQGKVEVNKDIQTTLVSNEKLDFWWLNNGITILASKASIIGKTITLDDVQIVNGLQTTTIIYNYLKDKNIEDKDKSRSILVRIIVTQNSEARDRIIKATNFQTMIPIASLRATDHIHRNIEDYFLSKGWFYDRRKNYYKNIGKPIDKIISIPYLSQAIMAIILREPNNARARPSSLLKQNTTYKQIFDESLDPEIYLLCAKIMKNIEKFLREKPPLQQVKTFKFHLAMVVVIKLLGKIDYDSSDILSLSDKEIPKQLIINSLSEIFKQAQPLGSDINKTSKSKEFVNQLLENILL